jgi:hypothetical protein
VRATTPVPHPAPQQPDPAEDQPLADHVGQAAALYEPRDLEREHEGGDDGAAGDRPRARAVSGDRVEGDVEGDPALEAAAHVRARGVARVARGDHEHQDQQRRTTPGEQRKRDRRDDYGVDQRRAVDQYLDQRGSGQQRHEDRIGDVGSALEKLTERPHEPNLRPYERRRIPSTRDPDPPLRGAEDHLPEAREIAPRRDDGGSPAT